MTSFYMFRLYFVTFAGPTRVEPALRSRLNDPGNAVLVPLYTLAVLSIFGGFIGLPQFWGDVIGLDGRGRFAIVEVKSSLADFRADEKWPEYLAFCDWFYFAVAPDFPRDSLPDETGIIIADRFGGEIARTSPDTPMATQARHRQTLLFAHTASARLFRLTESGL